MLRVISLPVNEREDNYSLCDPEPDPLHHIPRHPRRPILRIQCVLTRENVRLFRLQPLGPLENLPEDEQGKIDRNPHVSRHERIHIERPEDVEAVEDCDDGEEDEGEPCRVRLERGSEDQGASIDILGFKSSVEFDVGDRDGHPGEEVRDGGEVLEPLEDDVGARGARHVRQKGYSSCDNDTIIWNPPPRTLQEKPWRLSVLCQCVKVPRTGE